MSNKPYPLRGIMITARDTASLATFYSRVLGWSHEYLPNLFGPGKRPSADTNLYAKVETGFATLPYSGIGPVEMLVSTGKDGLHVAPGVSLNYAVTDIDAALAKALNGGAVMVSEVVQIGDRGWIVGLRDPEGNDFAFWQPPADWPGDDWSHACGFDPQAGWRAPEKSVLAAPLEAWT